MLKLEFSLPSNFNAEAFLNFHQRDKEHTAEHVCGQTLFKAILYRHQPAILAFKLYPAFASVEVETIHNDANAKQDFILISQRMLGLTQDTQTFESIYSEHPVLAPLIKHQAGLKLDVLASPFEALSWAIIGQQISLAAATSVRRRFILTANIKYGDLYCYPDEKVVIQMGKESLCQSGLSATKAITLLRIADMLENGQLILPLRATDEQIKNITQSLINVNGIGDWTLNYCLLRGYAWLDGALQGDVAVRNKLQALLNLERRPSITEAKLWLEDFKPWRSLVAAHLWAYKDKFK